MNSSEQLIRFICTGCDSPLTTVETNAGQRVRCTHCSTPLTIPGQAALSNRPELNRVPVDYPVVTTAQQKQPVVPLKIALPKNLGGIETTVTQGTANSMAKVVIGGFLVAIGVMLSMVFGGRRTSA